MIPKENSSCASSQWPEMTIEPWDREVDAQLVDEANARYERLAAKREVERAVDAWLVEARKYLKETAKWATKEQS